MEREERQKNKIERLVDRFKKITQPSFEPQAGTAEVQSSSRLPPISDSVGRLSPSPRSPRWSSSDAETQSWTKYRSGCLSKSSLFADWAGLKKDKKIPKNNFVEEVTHFLKENKSFLELYVIENIPVEEVEKMLARKYNFVKQNDESVTTVYKDLFLKVSKNFDKDSSEHSVVCEISRLMSRSLEAESYKTYKLYPEHPNFVQYFDEQSENPSRNLVRANIHDTEVVNKVAMVGDPIKNNRLFNNAVDGEANQDLIESHVLYLPVFNSDGIIAYVIELGRRKEFLDLDVEKSGQYLVWGSLLLHYCNLYLHNKRERSMSDFLLEVVRAVFEEMVSLDQLIKRILEFAQRLVNADRASLFLVDYRNSELVSTVFDLKFEPGQSRDVEKKEIRMPINRGIAGHVALSGETMNIPDAYSDHRFNREVDEATGYKTKCILCMPIKVQGKVIGVVQMVNKRTEDNFDHNDESAFEIFSSFFGLALHHARLYDRIMRKEQKYRVALEVLSYHNTCRENEVTAMLTDKEEITSDLNNYYLDPYLLNEFEKCKAVISMFNNLFDISKFDLMTVTRFVLTVKKNYRTVPYHNFDHGWSVAHAMYVILKNDTEKRYTFKMRLALFIACLCHDLDHRGYTNKYMSETASPLAAMYTTSTLEHHHFNITVTILQQDGHNIFSHMSSDDYKDILGLIRHCILATDLAAFFPNLAKIKELSAVSHEHAFNWTVPAHRELAMAISMTAADLSASAKPWEVQIKTVKVIFEEFYDQGDKERQAGRLPIPMMDRNQTDEQPSSQVGFLSQICIPCYASLFSILPNTKPMYKMAKNNLYKWKCKADKIERKKAGILEDVTRNSDSEENLSDDVKMAEYIIEKEDAETETVSEETVSTDDEPPAVDVELEVEELVKEVVEREESGAVWKVMKRSSASWEDGEEDPKEQRVGSGIWKDIDGVTWNDEGLVVGPRKTKNKKNAQKEK